MNLFSLVYFIWVYSEANLLKEMTGVEQWSKSKNNLCVPFKIYRFEPTKAFPVGVCQARISYCKINHKIFKD